MEELEQKHLHLLQVVESEKTAKWQYTQHCEELTEEIKKLRTEVRKICILLCQTKPARLLSTYKGLLWRCYSNEKLLRFFSSFLR